MKTKIPALLLTILFLLTACQPAASPTANATLLPTSTPTVLPSSTPTSAPIFTGSGGGVIAYTAINASNERISEISLMNADGSELQSLPNSGGGPSGWAPAWSPDGKWLAYIAHRSDSNWPLYVIGSDGSNRQELLTGDLYHYPSWSPDSSQIAYSRNGNICVADIGIDGNTITLSNETQLTFLEQQYASVSSWSPDGQQIVFASMMGDARGTSSYFDPNSAEIYVINADGTNLHKLTENDVSDSGPKWSPDGSSIAFISARDGTYQIYTMGTDGTEIQQLTQDAFVNSDPAWSPDGKRIAFSSNRDGNFEVYVMNANGSDLTRLTNTTADDFLPAWRPEKVLAISLGNFAAILPYGAPSILDGQFFPGEWDNALRQETTNGGEILMMNDGDFLYLGIDGNFEGVMVTSVCLAHNNQVEILHSSASLGTALFAIDDKKSQLTQPFNWDLYGVTSNTTQAEGQRQAFFMANNWLANLGTMSETAQTEYQIAIPEGTFHLGVGYLLPPNGEQAAWWPAGLADDCRKIELLQGNSGEDPDSPLLLQFSPETWITVSPH